MRTSNLYSRRGLAAAATLTVAGWAVMAPPAAGVKLEDKEDPAGNNGMITVTPHVEEDGSTPPCVFDLEWYGFDEGPDIVSRVVFEMKEPTGDVTVANTGPSDVFVGGDPATGAGTETGFDGRATYVLAFTGAPDPQQGYHVKVTAHTPGSHGADTKYKTFWVQPCPVPPPPPDPF